jgi:hypothetical protein
MKLTRYQVILMYKYKFYTEPEFRLLIVWDHLSTLRILFFDSNQ